MSVVIVGQQPLRLGLSQSNKFRGACESAVPYDFVEAC